MSRRVVVTGLGAVSSVGKNVSQSWDNILASKSGIRRIPSEWFDSSDLITQIAGSIPDEGEWAVEFDDYISAKDRNKTDRFIHLAHVAADHAVKEAGLDTLSEEQKLRAGVLIGSGIGGLATIERTALLMNDRGPKRVSPFFIPASLINLASGQVSIKYGFKGPNHSVVTACATGTHAIGDANRMIKYGDADVMVAGGAEKASTELGIGGFGAARALSTRNEEPTISSRPWDKDSDGFLLGDGAGMMVLEDYDHAVARGAKIYAELVGFGMSGDAYHMTSPPEDGNGAARSMQNALNDAGIEASQVGYINAHGTSTPAGDKAETQAVKTVFGSSASTVLVSSSKSMIGHLLGAAGAVESIITVMSLIDQKVHPTINLDNPDEGCDLDYVADGERAVEMDYALCNSFGFGGTNGTLIFKKV